MKQAPAQHSGKGQGGEIPEAGAVAGQDPGGRPPAERHASWLELFFDLVFVVAVAQLGQTLTNDPSAGGLLRFGALFVPVWWAWNGYTFYADRFDTDDAFFRIAMLAGMFATSALAVNIGKTQTGGSAAFAASYVAVRFVLIILYARARRTSPEAEGLATFLLGGFVTGAAIWLISLAVGTPLRFWMWGAALAVEMATPLLARRFIAALPVHASHIPERIGLFTTIVFGESVFAVASATARGSWEPASSLTAGLGFVAIASLWWLYFDYVDREQPMIHGVLRGQIYVYGHLPLLAALTAFATGVKLAILSAGQDLRTTNWALPIATGLAVFFVVLAQVSFWSQPGYPKQSLAVRLGAGALIAGLTAVAPRLSPALFMGFIAIVLVAELLAEIRFQPRTLRSNSHIPLVEKDEDA